MVASAIASSYLPPLISAAALAAISLSVWVVRWPRLAVGWLVATVVVGQIIRFPLPGQGGGVLLSDVAVLLVLVSAGAHALFRRNVLESGIRNQESRSHSTPLSAFIIHDSPAGRSPASWWGRRMGEGRLFLILILPFLLWSLFTLVIRLSELGAANSLVAVSYWFRLSAHILLLPALLVLFSDSRIRRFAHRALLTSIVFLLALGLLQMIFLPNIAQFSGWSLVIGHWGFQSTAWDPHQSRVVSTWLDPNFFGIFLAMTTPFILWMARRSRSRRYWVLLVGVTAALVLTQSRSSYVALLAVLLLLPPVLFMKLSPLALFGSAFGRSGGGRHLPLGRLALAIRRGTKPSRPARDPQSEQEKVTHPKSPLNPHTIVLLLNSIVFFVLAGVIVVLLLGDRANIFRLNDPTVALRLGSLRQVWQLAERTPWLGVGYNAYQFAAQQAGLIGDFTIHSRAGADNSLLTLWVTTGLIGVVLFFLPWLVLFGFLIRRWVMARHGLSLAAAAGLLALFIDSQFINSFLYPHLLIVLILIIALALSENFQSPILRPRQLWGFGRQAIYNLQKNNQ